MFKVLAQPLGLCEGSNSDNMISHAIYKEILKVKLRLASVREECSSKASVIYQLRLKTFLYPQILTQLPVIQVTLIIFSSQRN